MLKNPGVKALGIDRRRSICSRALSGSPAENMGDNHPPGGLSPLDIEGNSRVVDGIVDIGFAEGIDVIFACSFETGDLTTRVDDSD